MFLLCSFNLLQFLLIHVMCSSYVLIAAVQLKRVCRKLPFCSHVPSDESNLNLIWLQTCFTPLNIPLLLLQILCCFCYLLCVVPCSCCCSLIETGLSHNVSCYLVPMFPVLNPILFFLILNLFCFSCNPIYTGLSDHLVWLVTSLCSNFQLFIILSDNCLRRNGPSSSHDTLYNAALLRSTHNTANVRRLLCVFWMCFESPFTRMISNLKYKT